MATSMEQLSMQLSIVVAKFSDMDLIQVSFKARLLNLPQMVPSGGLMMSIAR